VHHGTHALKYMRLKAFILFMAVLFVWPMLVHSQVKVPVLNSPVTDLTGTLSAAEIKSLEVRLLALEKRKGSQLIVVMLPSTQPEDIASFALAVFEKNKIGREKSDDGILLLIAKDDRKVRIEAGYGLEGAIPDAIAARIIREYMQPKFRQSDYAGGINDATSVMEKIIDGEPLPAPLTVDNESGNASSWAWIIAVIIGFQIGGFSSGMPVRPVFIRRVLAAAAAGFITWVFFSLGISTVIAAVVAFLLSGAQSAGRYVSHGGGGWIGGGGSSGGGWSGGGSSGGGWSGGGGSSGGGGASGDW
jgi:uncharacterized protein